MNSIYTFSPTISIERNAISVLLRLDSEANQPNITANELGNVGRRITCLLRKFEEDFGTRFMINAFKKANEQAGHTIGPLEDTFVFKLMEMGFTIENVRRVVKFKR